MAERFLAPPFYGPQTDRYYFTASKNSEVFFFEVICRCAKFNQKNKGAGNGTI